MILGRAPVTAGWPGLRGLVHCAALMRPVVPDHVPPGHGVGARMVKRSGIGFVGGAIWRLCRAD